ncbi:DUF3034 family protein [Pelomonas sp. SE-A7]|uniref:DUF3034 family protein n=1 Tax=Pelomonas sp. SE-A7 TaxID=3054953 RepID=UPI00259C75A3|nr:DUF3034 family protein [Pelomonas sp. SE-A7]MDM4766857.1 DUF3034 family protein [Pelomonas sp. SE-A7]
MRIRHALAVLGLVLAAPAFAGGGKLLLTGGVSTVEGAAGGGLSPWALTGSYAAPGEWGATAHATRVSTQDYSLNTYGALLAWDDRLEFSLAHQSFDTGATGTALGLPGLKLKQDIFGAKLRLAGDAIVDSDSAMPQIAIGFEHKRADAGGLAGTLASLGAAKSGTDLYISATKLLLREGLLLNLTLRATKANQMGLLGFGGTASSSLSLQPEVSVAWLLNRTLAIGAEFRAKPDKLNPSALGAGLREDDWKDLFIAWAPSKQFSLTAAWVDLGSIVPAVKPKRQTGAYLSAQLAF